MENHNAFLTQTKAGQNLSLIYDQDSKNMSNKSYKEMKT